MPRFHKRIEKARLSIAGARAAYIGVGLDLSPHKNAAATLAIAPETPFVLRVGAGREGAHSLALIPPNTLHHLRANGAMAFVYLDALSDDYQRVARCLQDNVKPWHARAVAACASPLTPVNAICGVFGASGPTAVPTALRSVIRAIDARPQDFASVSIAASRAFLSPSRFQARFTEAVGVPLRKYRQWRRMALVFEALAQKCSLTDASFEAGFASSSHFSTAFRRMFGLPPSRLLELGVQIDVDR
jgi:AraC-like DNA-binding protein